MHKHPSLTVRIFVKLTTAVDVLSINFFLDKLFEPYGSLAPLRVVNITQFTAQLRWNLPMGTKKELKAMRVS